MDRVPIDFGSTPVTGISISIVSKLREYYKIDNKTPVKVTGPFQMLGEVADGLKKNWEYVVSFKNVSETNTDSYKNIKVIKWIYNTIGKKR